ncbi:hypothetical protein BSR82_04815 [Bacillus subtilis]|nr:hypothetical protein BSR82_04815 [Bacillus subtilis]
MVIYQAEYRWVLGGELYDCFIDFLKKRIGWQFCERRVRWRYHDNLKHQETEWKSIDDEFQEQVIDIDKLYVDGKEQSIK